MAGFRPERRSPGEGGDMKGITQDEISKLQKAMKQKEFRDHIDEYTREVSDPAHRQEYLDYLAQIEAKGEMPDGQSLLRCQPGLCVKTNIEFKTGQKQKCFINIVHTDLLDDLQVSKAENGSGHQVHLPYSLSPPRPDRDQKDEYCMTCDFAVSTGTFQRAAQSSQILKLLIDTAADGLSQQFLKGHEEVSKDYKVMQRMACKGGQPMPMSVRAELLKDKGRSQAKAVPDKDAITPSELKEMREEAKRKKKAAQAENDEEEEEKAPPEPKVVPGRIRVPQHRLVHSGQLDLTDFMEVSGRQNPASVSSIPRHLKLVVELPTVKKSSDIKMEVTNDNVVIEVEGKFYLDMPWPYEVQDSQGSAKFDKAKQTLTLELPVVPKLPDPEALAAAQRLQGLGVLKGEDADVTEDEDLPPLEEPEEPTAEAELPREAAEVKEEEAQRPPPEPPAPEAQVKRELLELEPSSSLRVAEPPQVEEVADACVEEVEDRQPAGPPFLAAEQFEGAKAGYYFGTGEEGLGYYRDLRQRRPDRPVKPPEPVPPAPLVEVEPRYAELPAYAARYLEEVDALSMRLPAEEAEVVKEEPSLEYRLGRQNLLLRIALGEEDAADLRLSLVGRRLMISFCSRPAQGGSEPSRWRRRSVKRSLCGAVDLKQSSAEVTGDSPRELQVVLRKAVRNEVWDYAFEKTEACAEKEEAIALGLQAAPASEPAELERRPEAQQDAPEVVEDSAELDVAPPVVQDSTQAPVRQVEASPNAVQSAVVMGQSVLLQNRLMYQLL